MIKEVRTSQVTKLTIISDKGLDPVNVFLEDYSAGCGKTTIECFGESWSYFWGGMGDRTMKQFILETDDDYLAKKFAPEEHRTINDNNTEVIIAAAKKQIIEDRRHSGITKDDARDLWQEVEDMQDGGWEVNHGILSKVFGDEWYYQLPTISNYKYDYLVKIIQTVREGIRRTIPEEVMA